MLNVAESGNQTVFPVLASNAFDIFLFEVFTPLLTGGTALLLDADKTQNMHLLATELEQATAFHAVPALMSEIIDHISGADAKNRYSGIRELYIGGDVVPTKVLHRMREALPDANINILYGPTEASVFAIASRYESSSSTNLNGTIIGRPCNNNSVYILDDHGNLLPVGVQGEICLSGKGLSRGYLNMPDLTAEKFIPNPFVEGELLYKTGDLGKWLTDGAIEFVGRKDHQVKIRGNRVELGEIEKTLERHVDIESAVVVSRNDQQGEKELVAYFVGNKVLQGAPLRVWLSGILPSYMLPAHFVQLDSLPISANGKVNRQALPDVTSVMGIAPAVEAGRSPTEERLAQIWAGLLNKNEIHNGADFFESGGHSLKAIRLVSQIHKEFGVKLTLSELFVHTRLKDQAVLIDAAKIAGFKAIAAVTQQEHYVLSSAQRRLLVLSQFEGANEAYNMASVYVIQGALHIEALRSSFFALLARHEILRTVFREDVTGMIRQFIMPANQCGFELLYHDLPEAVMAASIQELVGKPFDLSKGPLIRAAIYRTEAESLILACNMHHIISDGWSMGILIRDLFAFYRSYANGQPVDLPVLRIQYKDYASWQQEQLSGGVLEAHRAYWLTQLGGELPVLQFPTDRPRPREKTYHGDHYSWEVDAPVMQRLQMTVREENVTVFMLLLAIVDVLLYKYTGQEDIVIGSPVAGREHADLEDQIGFYLNTLPLRLKMSGQESFRQILEKIREATLGAYEHQAYPFDALINDLNVERDLGRNALFDVMVVLQNADRPVQQHMEGDDDVTISPYRSARHETSQFDMTFNFAEKADGLQCVLEYNTDLFEERTIHQIARHFNQLLEAALSFPDNSVLLLEFLN